MKNIAVNFRNNTIEISKTFEKAASIYGSKAYNELMNVKRDFPTFTVDVVKPVKKTASYKGLTLEYMKKYIIKNSGENSEQMETFNRLCGSTNANDEISARASYGQIKLWFLNEYPEIENARAEIDEIIAKAKAEREAKKNCKESAKPEELENDKDTDEE